MNDKFTWLDVAVLAVYFVGITAMGLWLARRVRSSGGYFMGDRKLRWWIMVGQSFGTGTHAEQPVAQTGATCELGFATIWYQWKNMLITPFYWLMAPWYRRSNRTTVGEMVEDRYGTKLAFIYTVFAIAFFVFNQGAMLKGAGKVISVATGIEAVSANTVVVAMTVAFILYSFFGGLIASAHTDFVQAFLIICLSFMLIPKGLIEVGGFAGMRASLPPDFFKLYSEVSGLSAFTIAMLTVNGLVGIVAQPHTLSMCATGNTERAGRVGQTYGSMVKRFCTIGWALTGLIVAAMLIQRHDTLPEREAAFGFACRELLGPGFVGLMIACVLAANMSTCSNFMVNIGALFTRNLYCQYIHPGASDRRILLIGRLSGLGLTLLGVAFALTVDRVLDAFLFTETIAAFMGIMFISGILWKRANRYGAFAGTVAAFGLYYALNYLMTCRAAPDAEAFKTLSAAWAHLTASVGAGGLWTFLGSGVVKLVYPWKAAPFGWAMLVGFATLIAVSLCSKREDDAQIAQFFDKMRHSSDDDAITADGQRQLAAERGEDLLLLDLPGWLTRERWHGFFRRYREDIIGFALGWATVAFLIFTAWAIVSIGA
ncbi:MAG TPA: sodium:solute symporter family protein [Candidatus Hydrogenedentes bacterium]|nr:sodium:solute symporter family protein [Candidatus Hydrogenedentota bacterium]HPG65691.1 sodium:solute symporter family protein [Candidatus Hydrogenedentota bacterium]